MPRLSHEKIFCGVIHSKSLNHFPLLIFLTYLYIIMLLQILSIDRHFMRQKQLVWGFFIYTSKLTTLLASA